MSEEFPIKTQPGKAVRTFLHSQFFGTPPYPTQSFANQTIIVTGANTGLGFEAARHFYRLNCAKLILAVRTVSKGEAAKEDIVRTEKHRSDGAEAIEVWQLDLQSTKSTLDFVERAKKELVRIDALVENAGINNPHWAVSEGFEDSIQVNVINTFLLALSLLPRLIDTKAQFPGSLPHLVVVSSEAHRFSPFKNLKDPDIYKSLNDETTFDGYGRYPTSKLLEVLFVRELVARLEANKTVSEPLPVVINLINPGLCASNLDRNMGAVVRAIGFVLVSILARTLEVGSRTLVYGASAGPNSHGEFMSDGKNQEVEQWIYGDVGSRAQKKVFEQTMKVLEARSPGIGKPLGL